MPSHYGNTTSSPDPLSFLSRRSRNLRQIEQAAREEEAEQVEQTEQGERSRDPRKQHIGGDAAKQEFGGTDFPDGSNVDDDPLSFLGRRNKDSLWVRRPDPDIGVLGSFGEGIKRGLVEPFTIIRGKPEIDPRIDSGLEKTSEFLGSFVGLGISFIPFVKATGWTMRGAGLMARVSPRVTQVLNGVRAGTIAKESTRAVVAARNAAAINQINRATVSTIAGGVQFAGVSEEVEEIPQNIAIGLAFGAAIEAVFFAAAARGRANDIARAKGRFVDNGGIADEVVSPEKIAQENVLTPNNEALTTEQIAEQFMGLANPATSYEQSLAILARERQKTMRITPVENEKLPDLLDFIHRELGGEAALQEAGLPIIYPRGNLQVLTRKVMDGKASEVLVHNPLTASGKLTPKQVAQWQATGYFEGMRVQLAGKTYSVGSHAVAKGNVPLVKAMGQGRQPTLFAAAESNITKPIIVDIDSPALRREEILNAIASQEWRPSADPVVGLPGGRGGPARVGFAFEIAPGVMQRASINTEYFLKYESMEAFLKEHGSGVYAGEINRSKPLNELIQDYFKRLEVEYRRGPEEGGGDVIHGLIIQPEGAPPEFHIMVEPGNLGESAVGVQLHSRVPSVGIEADAVKMTMEFGPEGNPVPTIQSFIPSWKNNLMGNLAEAGVPEAEAAGFIDARLLQMTKQMEDLVDDELSAAINHSKIRAAVECI